MLLYPLLGLLFFWISATSAGNVTHGQPCVIEHNRLQTGTYQFYGDCSTQNFCDPVTKTCQKKQCRKDDFPFGYTLPEDFPDKCPRGTFCPDEMDACLPWVVPGGDCQKNRDDQCEGPPNFRELTDQTQRGLNFNGSVCLNNKCFWANVTENNACELENTAYIGYSVGGEFIDIVSRGNCRVGLYCDAQSRTCLANKAVGAACGADKECDTWNCLASGVCGVASNVPQQFAAWVYVVVGVSILVGMFVTLGSLYLFHKRSRTREREKRAQYWREQNAFHQNLLQMRDTARASFPSMAGGGLKLDDSDDTVPLTSHAAPTPKGSGLRYTTSEGYDDTSDDEVVYQHQQHVQHQQYGQPRMADNRF